MNNDKVDAVSLSSFVLDGKRLAYIFVDFMKKYFPGFERAFVSATADDLGIRGYRWIVGRTTFTKKMKTAPYRCEDAIGVGVAGDSKSLNHGERAWKAQVFTNDVFEIPLSCLLPVNIDNLIIGAGRGACSDPPLLLRVMGVTMTVGQGAGIVAAVAVKQNVPVSRVSYPDVRRELVRQGVEFPET